MPAIAVRAENVPNIDWDLYSEVRDALRNKTDIASYRQSRVFSKVSSLSICVVI